MTLPDDGVHLNSLDEINSIKIPEDDNLEHIRKRTLEEAVVHSLKRCLDMFVSDFGSKPVDFIPAKEAKVKFKVAEEYPGLETDNPENYNQKRTTSDDNTPATPLPASALASSMELALSNNHSMQLMKPAHAGIEASKVSGSSDLENLVLAKSLKPLDPVIHPKWKLQRVISGHQGWVQCIAVDHSNEWFASSGNDRIIKIWDLASGILRLSLTGHINTVRALVISARHPYMFSCGEDNRVKCWDLEHNKVVRDYHGHLSGVYCLTLHPSLDILASGGRDAVIRVWDIRSKQAIHVLAGHTGTVSSLQSQTLEPQLISGSQDKMIRLWDLVAGKCSTVLTHHKKSVRALSIHPRYYAFSSCAAESVKVWQCPEGKFERNFDSCSSIINCSAIKDDGNDSSVLAAGTNDGTLIFWDWKSGRRFQTIQSRVQPGSLESENGIFSCVFDKSESRLITGECDKTIKVWKEDNFDQCE